MHCPLATSGARRRCFQLLLCAVALALALSGPAAALPVITGSSHIGELLHAGQNLKNLNVTLVDFTRADLTKTKFNNSTITFSNFSQAILTRTKFKRANLSGSNFSGAQATKVNFDKATVLNAVFNGANLTRAKLDKGNFAGSSFVGVSFGKADVGGTNLANTILFGANLTSVKFNRKTLWAGASYNLQTQLPASLPQSVIASMVFVAEPRIATLEGIGLAALMLVAPWRSRPKRSLPLG